MKGLFIPEITAEMFRNGCLESIEALMAEGEIYDIEYSRWIPVSERLPEVDVDVLVTDNGGGVPTVIIDACGMKDDTGERFWQISQIPVAWMEWPEPYKVESEDKA